MGNSSGSKILGSETEKLHDSGVEVLPDATVLIPGLRNISWSGVMIKHASLCEGQEEKKDDLSSPGVCKKKLLHTAFCILRSTTKRQKSQ